MEIEHLAARIPDDDQHLDVRDGLGRPVLERGGEGVERGALGEDPELLDDVVEVDQILQAAPLAQLEGGRLRRREGDRGGREVAQEVHREREVQVLTLRGGRRRDADDAARGIEDRSPAASRADGGRDLQEPGGPQRPEPTHDSGRNGALEALRAAQDDNVLSDDDLVRVGQRHGGRRVK